MQQTMKIDVMMDAKTFRDFAFFDNFRYRKIWKRPLIFAGIFTVFSILCFAMKGAREQAELLGAVLLLVGLGLPLVYFAMFFRTVTDQIRRLKLTAPRLFYTVILNDGPDGILMSAKGAADQTFSWEKAERAYRIGDTIYFYVAPGSALILPCENARPNADTLWAYLSARLSPDRLTEL